MSQPDWECIAQLGDANPTEYGGYWIFRDKTGVYAPEGEYLFCPDDEDGEYEVYRFSLDKCTFINGVLSDNKFHPECSAWFATPEVRRDERPQDTTYLSNIASCMDSSVEELIGMFTSDDIVERAEAYRMVGEYHGFMNLDEYPLHLTRAEVERRYDQPKYQEV